MAVIYHGNGECAENYLSDERFAPGWQVLGYDMCLVEYRGYSYYNRQLEPRIITMLSDTAAIHRKLLHDFPSLQPEEDIVVLGRSIGSIYASEHASYAPGLRAVIIESGFAEPGVFLLRRLQADNQTAFDEEGILAESREKLNNAEKLRSYPGKLLLMHAVDDTVVPSSEADLNFASSTSKQKKLVIFSIGDHNYMRAANFFAYWREIAHVSHPEPEQILQHPFFHQMDPILPRRSNDESQTASSFKCVFN